MTFNVENIISFVLMKTKFIAIVFNCFEMVYSFQFYFIKRKLGSNLIELAFLKNFNKLIR